MGAQTKGSVSQTFPNVFQKFRKIPEIAIRVSLLKKIFNEMCRCADMQYLSSNKTIYQFITSYPKCKYVSKIIT